jgi:hypothetical protein
MFPYGALTIVGAKFSSSFTIDLNGYKRKDEVRAKIYLTNERKKTNRKRKKK